MKNGKTNWTRMFGLGVAVIATGTGGYAFFVNRDAGPTTEVEITLDQVIGSEELILRYTPALKKLSKTIANLKIYDYQSADLFADQVKVYPLEDAEIPAPDRSSVEPTSFHWPCAHEAKTGPIAEVDPLEPLFARVEFFDHVKVYFIRGEYEDAEKTRWRAVSGLGGLAKRKGGGWVSLSGKQEITFELDPDGEEDEEGRKPWRIVEWKQKKLDVRTVTDRLFTNVTNNVLADDEVRAAFSHSELADYTVASVLDENFEPPYYGFHWISWDQHPAVSVVDIDHDGHDDLYVMPHWGPSRLLRNRGGQTFTDVTEAYGLPELRFATSALFADYDNDGDSDLFVGRSLERSRYFRNDDGKFVAADETVGVELPKLVISMSAADYDQDGLLDVFFGTYAANLFRLERQGKLDSGVPNTRAAKFVDRKVAEELFERRKHDHLMKDLTGPPNLLLRNKGKSFEIPPANESLELWHHTYQAAWADYDGDGDQDVYLSNDFAPNDLLRNNGDGTFTDITKETQSADIGFGMGASWGDYDADGDLDLYVTNMYSKAGRRITAGLGDIVDDDFSKMAAGNTLFRNEGADQAFAHVSGLEAPKVMVEKAGWGWGAQFTDFDNDGNLDIYAPSGFYSAPKQIAADVDL